MKKIQIYGLPRSGTNYLEYLIINNINCIYSKKIEKDIFGLDKWGNIARKHYKPNKEHGDYFIIILKESGNYLSSAKKWFKGYDINEIIDIYKDWIKSYIKFYNENKENTIIIFHEDLINKEENLINIVSDKFNISIKNDEIIKSNKRIDGYQNGKGTDYVFEQHDEIEINDDYIEIKKLKTII